MSEIKPVYLFADSQPLFWKKDGQLFLKDLLKYVSEPEPTAAYIGYSNGNRQEYYEIFQSAMENIGINSCHMLTESYTDEDEQFIKSASVILLAGGDVIAGWDKIAATDLKKHILTRFVEGAVLVGVSAGAMQLGMCAAGSEGEKAVDTLQIIPFVIAAHQEEDEWAALKSQVVEKGGYTKGIGIPFGAGMIYHSDHSIEPVKGSIVEITLKGSSPVANILFPEEKSQADCALQ